MKKYIAFLLCLIITISLFSCDNVNKDTEDHIEKDDYITDTSIGNTNKQYYKIEEIELTKVRYYIYDSNGNIVLSDETDRPIDISMLGDNIVDICIGMGTGLSIHTYYDVQNNRFSEEYSYVAASSGNLVAYIDTSMEDPMTNRVLVIRDIFDKEIFYKSFQLDFSPTVHDPIESAIFTDGEAELEVVYLSERPPVSLSITIPIRRASNEGELLSQSEIAMEMYEAAIADKICVFDEHLGKIKLKACRFPSNNLRLDECDFLCKAILDMDQDGIDEYVIQSKENDHIVLHYYDEKVYSFGFEGNSFRNLNTDGTFYWCEPSDTDYWTTGLKKITFNASKSNIKEIYKVRHNLALHEDSFTYYLDGEKVKREEYLEYYNSHCKTRIAFTPFEFSCHYPISSEQAVEIASEYWNVKNGSEDGAAGTLGIIKFVLINKPHDNTTDYHIVWQEDLYSRWYDGWEGRPPKQSIICKELLVDATTGECKPYIQGKG